MHEVKVHEAEDHYKSRWKESEGFSRGALQAGNQPLANRYARVAEFYQGLYEMAKMEPCREKLVTLVAPPSQLYRG